MFLTKIRADAALDRSSGSDFWFTDFGLSTRAGVRVNASVAQTLPAVLACQRVLSTSFAVMPFGLFRPKPGGGKERVTDHWLYRLFAKRPNRFQTPFEWRLMLQGHLVLRGNAFCQITANNRGEITELLPLNPDRMQIELLSNGSYRYRYNDRSSGETIYYSRGQVWHLRGLSNDGIVGLNPIEAEREAIGEGLAMQGYSSRFYANDARPRGWVEVPGSFPVGNARENFREEWRRVYGGENRGKVAILDRGMKYHDMPQSQADMQFIEGRNISLREIARIFGVPPHKIGDLERATFTNIEHQSIEFWQDTMLAWTELWESSIEFFLLGEESDLEPEFDMDRMMRGDSAARSAYYASRTQWGSMMPSEVREREGDDPLPWLDFTMRPANMIRMDANGEVFTGTPRGPDRRENVGAMAHALTARMRRVIGGNAARMARRIVTGQRPSAEVLADALAVDAASAAEWLGQRIEADEQTITASLLALAMQEPNA